jgi:hypothetical protein
MSMADKTPLEKLDDAVHEYFAATKDDDDTGHISGWVLSTQVTRLVDEPDALPMQTSWNYTFGPQTSAELALGLVTVVKAFFMRRLTNSDEDDA